MRYDFTKEQILEAISGVRNMSHLAQRLGCSYYTAKKYANKWECTKEAFHIEWEKEKDWAESQLHKRIKEGDVRCLLYFLSRMAKDRGWGESMEINSNQSINGLVIIRHAGIEDEEDSASSD